MKFKSKYNPGDYVWVLHGEPILAMVESVAIYADSCKKYTLIYQLKIPKPFGHIGIPAREGEIFKTLKSLNKHYHDNRN